MYCFWFEKPIGVLDQTMIDESATIELRKAIESQNNTPLNSSRRHISLMATRASNVTFVKHNFGPWESTLIFGIVFAVTSLYGGIYFVAWNFHFLLKWNGLYGGLSASSLRQVAYFLPYGWFLHRDFSMGSVAAHES